MKPNELFEELINMFPGQDKMLQFLFFLLIVFFGLYVIFQFIFWLGRDKKKKTKSEPAKKESVPIEAKSEPKPAANKDKLVILEEPKPIVKKEEPSSDYYAHERKGTYITSSANLDAKNYAYGDNYLYNYYQEVAAKPTTPEPPPDKVIAKDETADKKELKATDQVLAAYNSLPDELKRYIISKIMTSGTK